MVVWCTQNVVSRDTSPKYTILVMHIYGYLVDIEKIAIKSRDDALDLITMPAQCLFTGFPAPTPNIPSLTEMLRTRAGGGGGGGG